MVMKIRAEVAVKPSTSGRYLYGKMRHLLYRPRIPESTATRRQYVINAIVGMYRSGAFMSWRGDLGCNDPSSNVM